MKYFMLFCQGMADQPQETLSGRTPLEAAKTPFMDLLAKKSRIGSANFVPRALSPTPDIACMSILGYDPLRYYTGAAPLEALARGVSLGDREVAFLCDFVTISEEVFVDLTRRMSPREAELLMNELNSKLGDPRVKFYPGQAHDGILILNDAAVSEDLDELECVPPRQAAGQKISKVLPQGKGAPFVKGIMDQAKKILENHEINRVRIDLKENPANRIWPWGQGKKPKLPAFSDEHRLRGAVVSEASFVKGLAKAAGMAFIPTLSEAIHRSEEFIFSYSPALGENDLKTKIRRIEEFDLEVVGPISRLVETHPEIRILVGTDLNEPVGFSAALAGETPFLLCGAGVESEPSEGFSEKSAHHKRFTFDQGSLLLPYFLKENGGKIK